MLLPPMIIMQKCTFRSVFPKFSSDKMTLCNVNDQTWFSDTITSARPWGSLKPSPFKLGFQHHSRGPADVNESKNMFYPYSGLSILMHGVIAFPNATSYDI